MLPLQKFTKAIWNNPTLDGVAIIAVQHVLESIYKLFCLLKDSELNPTQVFILGKCYSTSPEIFSDFEKQGFQISKQSLAFDSHRAFDDLFEENVFAFLKESIDKIDFKLIKKLIILDDGGHLLSNISKFPIPVPIIGIEQTSSGYSHILKKGCAIPVINVARSKAKLTIESPIIVTSCLKRLNLNLPLKSLNSKNILILGNGSIGKDLKNVITHANIFDPISDSNDDYFSLIRQADVIFGCSGSTSLPYQYYPLLKKGVTLASFSSSDREFEAHLFRNNFSKTRKIHENFSSMGITLLQSGFPINFWGSRNNIPLKYIQITLALLQAGIYQALEMEKQEHGIFEIDAESELLIMQEYKNLTGCDRSFLLNESDLATSETIT